MGILSDLLWMTLHLCLVAIDMAFLLLLFRMVSQWGRIAWIERINDTAKSIVDPLTAAVGHHWQALTSKQLLPRHALALSMLALCLARFVICTVAGLLLR